MLVIGDMNLLTKFIPFLTFLLSIESVGQWLNFKFFLGGWWIEHLLMSFLPTFFFIYYLKSSNRVQKAPLTFKLLFAMLAFSFVYGLYMSMGYQDILFLISKLLAWSLCLGWFYFQRPDNITTFTRQWSVFALPLFVILFPFMQGEAVGRFFAPISFVLMFYPYLTRYGKIIVVIVVIIVFLFGTLGARSSIIRFAVSAVFALSIYFKRIIPTTLVKSICFVLLVSPIVLLYLGISGIFNVFKIQDELGIEEYSVDSSFNKGEQENLISDTRTFLYMEEIQSAINNDYVVFGRSLSRGYDSNVIQGVDWKKDRNERWSCEVRMLNVFNYMGVVGVIIVALLYMVASLRALFFSKSYIMQIVGVYVAFRWFYAWVEDFDRFDFINLYLWIPIIMCYSTRFLNMSDNDFKIWIHGFFKFRKTHVRKN